MALEQPMKEYYVDAEPRGKVVLISGGGKIYTDIAARFVRSERELEEIVDSPYSKKIVENILSSGHLAATEFDYFIFGIEGFSRVLETQLVRKRMGSYLIKSGRQELNGKRQFSVAYPKWAADFTADVDLSTGQTIWVSGREICNIIRQWYEKGVETGIPEEELRYIKPQATSIKAIIGFNAHALLDLFSWRCCKNAQLEIRTMAYKMLSLCREAAPDLFKNAGPNCVRLGYCPENSRQNEECKGKVITKEEALRVLKRYTKKKES